ncbi:MAG: PD-(D/E)XK nuclease family protein, partial [Clostridia bacterium]|nr:PD-(D/E)XK nuclease family protein [Clostridia bacterium]
MDQVLAPLTDAWAEGPLREDPMGMQLGRSYVKAIRRAAKMFTEHAKNSRFTTLGAEVAFGREGGLPPVILTLKDGKQVALRGVIDRIDRYEGDGGLYLRVVDYKSSRQQLEPVRMWYGLQLQLLTYLQAAVQGVSGAKPAGAFYFTVRDPMVDSADDVKAAAEKAIADELRLKGVVLAEAEVVDAMDADVPEFSLEKVFNQNGSIAKHANAVNLTEMHALLDHARSTAAQLADRLRAGEIGLSPAQCGTWNACQWCDYAAVCRRDPRLPGGEFRELSAMDREEFARRLANDTVSTEDP